MRGVWHFVFENKIFDIFIHLCFTDYDASDDAQNNSRDDIGDSNRSIKDTCKQDDRGKSTNGEEIKKEKVTPMGRPAFVNPMKKALFINF